MRRHRYARIRRRKSPTHHRTLAWWVAAFSLLLLASTAQAQAPRTADHAVQAALENEAIDEWVAARLAENAEARRATLTRPNPSLAFGVDAPIGQGSASGTELAWALEQTFDVSRWRRDYRSEASRADAVIAADEAAWRLEVATAARTAFYAALRLQREYEVYARWVDAIEQATTGVRARVAQGDEAPIVLRSMEQSLAHAQLAHQSRLAAAAEAAAALEAWTGWQGGAPLEGELAPTEASSTTPTQRPELARLEQMALALASEGLALPASRGQGWSVGLGYRIADTGPRAQHLVLGTVAIPLAIRDTNAPQRARLDAQAEALRAERERQSAAFGREAEAARRRYAIAFRAVEHGHALASAPPLGPDMFEAFLVGEAELDEVLAAFEQDRDIALSLLELQWEARRAAIALAHALGQGVPE